MLNLDNIVSNKKKSSSENNDWPFSHSHLIKYIYTSKIPMKKSINI